MSVGKTLTSAIVSTALAVGIGATLQSAKADIPTFEPPTPLPSNTPLGQGCSYLTPDGLTMIIADAKIDGTVDLRWTQRQDLNDDFLNFQSIPNVNVGMYNSGGVLSANRLELYFSTFGAGSTGMWDIMRATRASTADNFGTPVDVGTAINTYGREQAPCLSPDGLTIYFDAELVPYNDATRRIFTSTRATLDSPWEPRTLLPAVFNNDLAREPCLADNGLTMYFSSTRPGGYGDGDIWASERQTLSSPWSEPINLGPVINTPFYEFNPFYSNADSHLYFDADHLTGTITDIYKSHATPEPATLALLLGGILAAGATRKKEM